MFFSFSLFHFRNSLFFLYVFFQKMLNVLLEHSLNKLNLITQKTIWLKSTNKHKLQMSVLEVQIGNVNTSQVINRADENNAEALKGYKSRLKNRIQLK